MLRTFARAAGIIAVLTGSAFAQSPDAPATTGVPFNAKLPPTAEEIARRQAAERDYNAAMQKIPDKKGIGRSLGRRAPDCVGVQEKAAAINWLGYRPALCPRLRAAM